VPTILTHPVVAALKTWFPRVPRRAIPIGMIATVLPDADVVAFKVGIPYAHTFGHRGFSHSIVFALIVAALGTLIVGRAASPPFRRRLAGSSPTFLFLLLCAVSHPLLDALTNGGLGVAFFSPFSNERYFFPWRPIRVSPIGPRFFSDSGVATLKSELAWVWLPFATLGALPLLLRRLFR